MSPIVNLQLVVKCKKRIFHSFRVKVALLRYIVFSFESGCDTSEPHVSTISRACSSLVRQSYYIPDCFILKISGLETILATEKGRWDGAELPHPPQVKEKNRISKPPGRICGSSRTACFTGADGAAFAGFIPGRPAGWCGSTPWGSCRTPF